MLLKEKENLSFDYL
jgi:hypothetical protein